MKALATVPFVDKYTQAFYPAGTVLNVTGERLAELIAAGVAEALEVLEPAELPTDEKPKKKSTRKPKKG